MADSKLKIDIRRERILEQLRAEGKVSVSQLSSSLGATPVTIRNDLAALEKDGYLLRMQGGAVLAQRINNSVTSMISGDQLYSDEKKRIAQEAVKLIQDGNTIFINSGTTTLQVAKSLRSKKGLNIVTNSLAVAIELGDAPTFRVLLLGGEINVQFGFTCGGDAQEQLGKYKADWAILSVDGISTSGGVTTHHAEEAIIDRMMIGNARNTMIVADSSKIGRDGFSRVSECNKHTWLISDSNCDVDAINEIKSLETNVVLA